MVVKDQATSVILDVLDFREDQLVKERVANQEDLQKSSSTKDSKSSSKGSSSLSKRSQAAYEDTGRQLEGWRKQAQEMADKMKKNERKGN